MKLAVITPVGPGHESYVERCKASVIHADKCGSGFTSIEHVIVDDSKGELGRSKARNQGMIEADWYFFLDADDRMRWNALMLNNFNVAATFGAVCLDGRVELRNKYPCGWAEISKYGADGTLSMGFFCRAKVARRLKFNEDMDAGEDFEFYLRLPGFVKLPVPLVDIGYSLPSASGPRGYERIDWTAICSKVIDDFGRNAVLEKTRRS